MAKGTVSLCYYIWLRDRFMLWNADVEIAVRPSVRPAHQRYPQPNFTFPVTPPSTAVVDSWAQQKTSVKQSVAIREVPATDSLLPPEPQWTPTPTSSPLDAGAGAVDLNYFQNAGSLSQPRSRRRALSDSTVRDAVTTKESDSNTGPFSVSNSRWPERDGRRALTTDDLDIMAAAPLLDVSIPSWRLGTPRFTMRGSPIFRGSSYAPTEDLRSSMASGINTPPLTRGFPLPDHATRKPHPLALPQSDTWYTAKRGTVDLPSPRMLRPSHLTYMSTHHVIEPRMFTDLTFKPACDRRDIVRYSATGAVVAATPPRLVAEITSPSFLDYELISDFFLTFRTFLDPTDLLRMLVARLRWSLGRDDEVGMIVRVRTFVALRHWILNYFMDDFLPDHNLRVSFCGLLNEFVEEVSQTTYSRRVQLKILTELKKCWRRVCTQYWDGTEFDDDVGPDVAITPGGFAGSRDPNLARHSAEGVEVLNADSDGLDRYEDLRKTPPTTAAQQPEIPKPLEVGDFVVLDNRPATPEEDDEVAAIHSFGPNTPLSMATSTDVISCSFPPKQGRHRNANQSHNAAAHPVPSSAVGRGYGHTAAAPKALVGKRVRPAHTHKRSNSLSDSLREHGSDGATSMDQKRPGPSGQLPPSGSLVRGNLLPPGQPLVNIESERRRYGHAHRQTTVFRQNNGRIGKDKAAGGAGMSGYGMRRLIRSVRNALKSKGHALSASQSNILRIASVGPKGATINRLPGTAVVPQAPRRQNGSRPPVRIDLLGAEVAEDFKKAIREEEAAAAAAADNAAFGTVTVHPPNSAPLLSRPLEYSEAHMDTTTWNALTLNQKQRPVSDMAITVGSKSIVIVDDTVPFDLPALRAKYSNVQQSGENAMGESFAMTGLDPTPPSTPPAAQFGNEQHHAPSYLVDPQAQGQSRSDDVTLPPFIPDLATLEGSPSSRASQEQARGVSSVPRRSTSSSKPPLSNAALRWHRRNRSSKTHQSINSILHGRTTSFGSARVPSTLRSFDATTDSGDFPSVSSVPMPEPLRVLRRRPGGDLKAANNVGDLGRAILRRSHSVGSLGTYSESIRSSYMLSTRPNSAGGSAIVTERKEGFSLGWLADKPKERAASPLNSEVASGSAAAPPSFEAEAQRLAQIPDEDDDGIESALLKLEGKFTKRGPKLSIIGNRPEVVKGEAQDEQDPVMEGPGYVMQHDEIPIVLHDGMASKDEKKQNRLRHVVDESWTGAPEHDGTDDQDEPDHESAGLRPPKMQNTVPALSSFLSEGSHDSYSSIPLLEREPQQDERTSATWADRSILKEADEDSDECPAETERPNIDIAASTTPHSSFDVINRTKSIDKIRSGHTMPSLMGSDDGEGSFLRDDSVDDSDLSSELSDEELADGIATADDYMSDFGRPLHPLREGITNPRARASSLELTLEQALAMSPDGYSDVAAKTLPLSWQREQPLPPTPELTPIMRCDESPKPAQEAPPAAAQPANTNPPKYSVHLPFILAFDSDILAQQFTLIEKDALNEIDWKELIDMNWKNCARSNSRSWVEFLKNTDAQGVEVVIARFNIMVKWAISEIVLTQNVEERARCVIKLIHMAAHCRRYRNFATLAQLTIALTSNEVSRLSKTWDLVPASDLRTLADLETLVTPSRNFHSIREEMEVASDGGCIPFVGIYTHDLLYIAQRPSEIASSPTTPPLVSFERCRYGAAVVKTLLRLLEASTRYTFQPMEGVTERCLWIGALNDDEIRRHSQTLE